MKECLKFRAKESKPVTLQVTHNEGIPRSQCFVPFPLLLRTDGKYTEQLTSFSKQTEPWDPTVNTSKTSGWFSSKAC